VSDPVSWLMIEPGWTVVDAEGSEVGTVEEVVGDSGEDIFNCLAVSTGLRDRRYVPAEQVREITENRVQLKFSADALSKLEEYKEPPESLEIEAPDRVTLWQRLSGIFRRG
jgi:hypothetical protein